MSKSKYMVLIDKVQANQSNWEERYRLLKLIKEEIGHQSPKLIKDIQKSVNVLSSQLLDVRSKIAKEASRIICDLACKFQHQFLTADSIINECLKGLSNSNTVLRECVQETIQTLIVQCQCSKSIPKLVSEFESKNNYVREKVAEYLLVMIQSVNIEKYKEILYRSIEIGVNDKVEAVRKIMRTAYIEFQKEYSEARNILLTLDPTAVKLIQQESKANQTESDRTPEYQHSREYSVASEKENLEEQSKKETKGKILRQNVDPKPMAPQRLSINSVTSRPKSTQKKSIQDYSSMFAHHIPPIHLSRQTQNSQQLEQRRYKEQRNEDIEFLIDKVESDLWNTRLVSLTKLLQILESREYHEVLGKNSIKAMVKSVVNRLEDTHQKVCLKAVDGISIIFPFYSNQFLQHLFPIIKRCVKGLTERNKDPYNQLLSIIKSFDMENVFHTLVKFIEQCKNKQKLICLDLMIESLECDVELVKAKDVSHIFKLMTNIIVENKEAAIPALAIISILREYHQSRMWSCFIHLSDHQMNKMIELAAEIDPALQYAILNFTKTNPRLSKEAIQQENERKSVSLLNIAELQAISRNPEFINQYIDLIYQKVELSQNPSMERLSVLIKNNSYLKEESIFKLFDILHLSSHQTVLISINNILDILILEADQLFVKCLCEVIKLAKRIHLDMYLQKLRSLVQITTGSTLQRFTGYIVDVALVHLEAEEVETRRACILVLAQLKNKLKSFPFARFKPREQRLIEKYSKQS